MSDSIDRAVLNDLQDTTGNDPAFLVELIDIYLVDTVGLLRAMEQAIRDTQTEPLRRAAHSLKSNSASLGARTLAGLCLEMEQQGRDGMLDGAPERLAGIVAAFSDVERDLRALRRTVTER
jgi:HPt (histidine-containing phosphotransfer) domain-containing protein